MKAMPVVDIKSHFSAVLAEVAKGEEIAITRHGRVVARLLPPLPTPPLMAAEAFRPYWHEGEIDLEVPVDAPPTPVPSLD